MLGAHCDSPCGPSPLGAHIPGPAPIPASPADTHGTGQDGDMGVMGDGSASPLKTDLDPDPALLPRAPNPDPEHISTAPAVAHGTVRDMGMGMMGDRSDSIRTPDDDPALTPIQGQDQAPQAQLCQPPPTHHPHMVHDHGLISAIGIMLYAVLYTLLADAPVHVSLS